MRLLLGAASILGLALFILPVAAEDPPAAPAAAEQPAAPAVEAAAPAPAIPEEVLKLIADTRNPSELDDQELFKRVKKALAYSKDDALPQDLREQLKGMAEAARGELQTRKQAAEQKKTDEQAASDQAAKEQAAAEKAAAAKVKEQADAEKAAAAQAAKEQADAEKAAAAQAAKEQATAAKEQAAAEKAAADKVGKDQAAKDQAAADKLAAEADKAAKEQAAAEKAAADQAAAQNAPVAPAPKPVVTETVPAVPAVVPPVAEVAPATPNTAAKQPLEQAAPAAPAEAVVEVPPPKLVVQAPPVAKIVPPPPLPPPESKPLPQVVVAAPPPPVVAAPSAADAKALDSNIVDPASEKQAQAYLADKSDLAKISDSDLRKRLDAVRELMAANELSRETERAVREKLKTERELLRQRVAEVEAAQQLKNAQAAAANPPPVVPGAAPKAQDQAATTNNTTNNTTINNTNIITVLTPPQQVLQDRRPAERLDLSELQIRIQIFGDAQSNNAYDPSYRDYWRASVERDRAILRRRLIDERHRREAELAREAADDSFEISNEYVPSDRPRRDVFAAEIDYNEMEDVLVAPPRRFSEDASQRYKVEEIATQPKLRNSISRIEIDTIRFGTNEAFIRDEQVGNLDGIAAIIEKIVKKYPTEVFLIEGHTDAPGSAPYNAKLSKLRAESIKKALVSYYVIPAKNLRTVGLGERFLKIPTAEAEPENRRVSIARITPLLTQR